MSRTTSAPIYTLHLYWKRFRLRPFTFTSKSRRCPTVNNRPLCLMLVGCCEYFIILPMSTVTYWNLKGDSSRLKIISKRRLAYETSMWDYIFKFTYFGQKQSLKIKSYVFTFFLGYLNLYGISLELIQPTKFLIPENVSQEVRKF